MLILTETTDNLQIVLAGAVTANQLQAYATWRDITTSAFTPGRSVAVTNNTTPVNIVGSPAASTQRVVDTLTITNKDTANATLTVLFNANGTTYELWSGLLQPGEHVEYIDGNGFRLFSAGGVERIQTITAFSSPTINTLNTVILSSDQVNNNAVANTLQDCTGMSFSMVAGETYWFRAAINYDAAASTTGSRWTVNGPASPTRLAYRVLQTLATSTITTIGAGAYQLPATASASSLTTGNIAIVEGVITPSVNGDLVIQFASEIAASAITAKAGSMLQWMRTL